MKAGPAHGCRSEGERGALPSGPHPRLLHAAVVFLRALETQSWSSLRRHVPCL